jgi:release factor glutamine methyltransferase
MVSVEDFINQATAVLKQAGIDSARLDCLILLEDVTGKDRAWLLAHPEHELPAHSIDGLNNKVTLRKQHSPLAYIRGQSEFYGRTFYVNQQVLEPRPETEIMIELLLSLSLPDQPVIVDTGTGSGALAITAKLELPQAQVYATDIDPSCLDVAMRNGQAHKADITWIEADLLESDDLPVRIDVIVANLPYVPDDFEINRAATHEPRVAIFGGADGLDLYRKLFHGLSAAYVLTESLPPHHEALAAIATAAGYELLQQQDFIQLFGTKAH